MTYAYFCESCGITLTVDEDGECSAEGEGGGMKQSCCHKCSNSECPDHGECNCFEDSSTVKINRDIVKKMIEDGTHPLLFPPDEDE